MGSTSWLANRNNDELHLLYRQQFTILFSTRSDEDFQLLRGIYAELSRRQITSRDERRDFFRAIITARMFDLLDHYDDDIADLKQSLPKFITANNFDQTKPSIWKVDPHTNSVNRENIELTPSHLLIVVSHPSCGFSAASTG
ncbi:MAG: hypothetical protein HC782_00935 [Gammaproteobacteria bacterium]|nr:hypothetical protein [Gammaproteobacteria bacterium]